MKDLIETTSELLAAIADEEKKLSAAKQPPSRYLAVAHGALRAAIDNLVYEQEARDKKPA